MGVITDEEYRSIQRIRGNTEQMSSLSGNQMRQLEALSAEYEKDRTDFIDRLRSQGLTDDQIIALDQQRVDAGPRNDGQGRPSALGPSILPSRRSVAGVEEGAKQAVEGALDLAMDISVAGEFITGDDEAARQKWKQRVNTSRMQRREENMQEFAQLPPAFAEGVGQASPWMLGQSAAASSWMLSVAQRGMQGGLMAASTTQAADKDLVDRWGAMTLGAAIGAGVQGLFLLPAWANQRAAKSFTKSYNNGLAEQAERVQQHIQRMTDNPNFAFSTAEITGSRIALGLELKAAGQATKAQANENLDILWKHFLKVSKRMKGEGATPAEIARATQGTLRKVKEDIYKAASTEWEGLSTQLLKEFGDDVIVDGRGFLSKIDDIVADLDNQAISVGRNAPADVVAYRKFVDDKVNPFDVVEVKVPRPKTQTAHRLSTEEPDDVFWAVRDKKTGKPAGRFNDRAQAEAAASKNNDALGGLTSQDVLDFNKGLNDIIGGKQPLAAEISGSSGRTHARAMMGALNTSLEAANNPRAANAIKGINDAYKVHMAQVGAIDELAISRMFGGKNIPNKPEKVLDRLLQSEKDDLVAVRNFLEEHDPELLESVRATHIERLARTTRKDTPFVDTETELTAMSNALLGANKSRVGKVGAGLHTAKTQNELRQVGVALRIMKNKYFKGIQPGGFNVDDLAINVISRSPEFMARFITRVATSGGGMETALLNPSTRRALITIAEGSLDSLKGKAAMVTLQGYINFQEDARKTHEDAKSQELLGQK